jgi:hypothetical protein
MKPELIEVNPPQSIKDYGRWLNEWGALEKHVYHTPAERSAYEDAISDAYGHFTRLVPDWHK